MKQLGKLEVYQMFNKEKVWANLEEALFEKKTLEFTPRRIMRLAATILLPILVAGGLAYWFLRTPSVQTLAEIDTAIKPGSQKAVLILSDGGTIELGQADSRETLHDGGASIIDENKGITYRFETGGDRLTKAVFNELRTPRGGGYNLQLADGTKVWLNAGSSLRYPVAFPDSTRQIFLNGEAYFEVTHSGQPFIVTTGDMNTRVLGTSFNISAYSDDDAFLTTLVEGRVRVELMDEFSAISTSTILEPDEQATLILSASEIFTAPVNASSYVSWIHGKMEFHNETLEIVMKRLARWYDFTYTFENEEARGFHFSARLDKEESISQILRMLEMTTDVKFEYRDNSIVVQ
jgi:ferric-dicitrate binding protein FerR (iron transport regulator)